MEIIDKIKEILHSNENKNEYKVIIKYLFILGLIGIMLLMGENLFFTENNVNNTTSDSEKNTDQNRVKEEKTYLEKVSSDLEKLISSAEGIGRVKVQIFPSSSVDYEYEYNTDENNKVTDEIDQNNGERRIKEEQLQKELVILKDANGNEKPVKSRKNNPEIESILIVAEGAENSKIKYQIYEAVSDFLNLSLHKISVLPYERR
ncbi:MAG: hypothetical protein ACOC1O_02320 [bacterium]